MEQFIPPQPACLGCYFFDVLGSILLGYFLGKNAMKKKIGLSCIFNCWNLKITCTKDIFEKCQSDFFHLCSINYYSSRVFLRKGNYGCDNQQRISPYLLNKFFPTKNMKIIFFLCERHNEMNKNHFYHVFLLLCTLDIFFGQIKLFIRFRWAFVFGFQTL